MAEINPKKVGDITYTQEPFWRIITLPIKSGATGVPTKGKLMTLNSLGQLINILGGSGVAAVTGGIFQALVTTVAATDENTDFIQVATMGSRILLKAPAGLTVGMHVSVDVSVAVVTADTVVKATTRIDLDRVGTIFEIYTRDAVSDKKQVTAVGDLIIVESGQF